MASEAWQARNERARALGYESYYDYRAHDNGRIPPSRPRLEGDELTRARGHRGARDFERSLEHGRVDLVTMIGVDRDEKGRIVSIHVQTITTDGRMRTWRLSGEAADPRRFVSAVSALGPGAGVRLIGSPRLLSSFGEVGGGGLTEEQEEFLSREGTLE